MTDLNQKNFNDIFELFLELYGNGDLEVDWRKDSTGLRSLIDLDDRLLKKKCDFDKEEFISATFEIIQASRSIALGEKPSDITEDQKNLILNKFLSNDETVQNIILGSTSNNMVFEDLDYEILTKRSKYDPNNILCYTILLNFNYKHGESQESINIELTKGQLKKIIKEYETILSHLLKIENEED